MLSNRWSSRLRGRSELLIQTRREDRPLVVFGGAAQLYVMQALVDRLSACGKLHSLDAAVFPEQGMT